MSASDDLYFKWICSFVAPDNCRYTKLLGKLYSLEFVPVLDMDGNRAIDGIDLRRYFSSDEGVEPPLQGFPCTMLELMVALARRMDSQILYDTEDRTSEWFWIMVDSLGLSSMTDILFDAMKVELIVHRFNNRKFDRYGNGSLFVVCSDSVDMRNLDIWYQMCAFIADRGL